MTRELTAATEHAGVRLDAFLSADGALTRSQAARLIAEGRVRVNGKPAAKSARLSGGETVTVDVPQLRETALPPQDIPLDVVYEDDDVIVVNKPTGLVVHPAPGHPDGTLVNALLHHCGDSLSGIGGEKRPGIVHRIDRDTSGLIIAAKNDAAHLALSAQLKDHSLSRTYECLVTGNMKQDSGTVDAPIGRSRVQEQELPEPENKPKESRIEIQTAEPDTATEPDKVTKKPVPATQKKITGDQARTSAKPVFKIQILVSNKILPKGSKQLKGVSPVSYYREKGLYKYTYGENTDYNKILRMKRNITPKFKDAFIIAFKNGEKMNVNEAIKEFKKNR